MSTIETEMEIERQILELFDACPTKQQLIGLSRMYSIPIEDLKKMLKKNGREIPDGRKGPRNKNQSAKVILMAADTPEEAERKAQTENITKMPDCVAKTIEKRMHELESDIKNYQNTIRNYQDMIHKLEAEYTAHADYLLNGPLVEQGNLSHSCSDNMIESPQPTG